MTVAELIKHLETFDPNLVVITPLWSEHITIEKKGIVELEACKPRIDGWVHDKRPDESSQVFLVIGKTYV